MTIAQNAEKITQNLATYFAIGEKLRDVDVYRTMPELFDGTNLRVTVETLRQCPLRNYLWAALFQAVKLHDERDYVEKAWKLPSWDFGRFARAHPLLFELSASQAMKRIQSELWEYWKYFGECQADADAGIREAFENCISVPGYDILDLAVREARRDQSTLFVDPDSPSPYDSFLKLGFHLQRLRAAESIMLPCHKLAPIFKCSAMTISRFRKRAQREGYLRLVKNHEYKSHEATEYKFDVSPAMKRQVSCYSGDSRSTETQAIQ